MQPCCLDTAQRTVQPSSRPDLVISICRTCGRRHLEAVADAGRIGVEQ